MSDPTSPDSAPDDATAADETEPATEPTEPAGEDPDAAPERAASDSAGTEGDDDHAGGTLELNPPKTTTPTTTAGEPVGGDESLYAGQIDPGLAPFVAAAVADLATRLGVNTDAITTISATLVTWSDSSMGCPAPGMEYAQVLEDGSLIELGYEGKVYRYHSGGERTPFLCDPSRAAPPVKGGAADD